MQAFTFVHDLKYGDIDSRNPFDVLAKSKGTCSGKHALLRLFLENLGYEVQSFFARHDFSRFPVNPWPEELQDFKARKLTDFHDFLKIRLSEKWMTIDAIFDAPLKKLGFPVADWDGESDMALPVKADPGFPS